MGAAVAGDFEELARRAVAFHKYVGQAVEEFAAHLFGPFFVVLIHDFGGQRFFYFFRNGHGKINDAHDNGRLRGGNPSSLEFYIKRKGAYL